MNKMEKQRQRRWKSVSGIEGVNQIQKHKAPSRLSSVSYDESIRDDMFTLDLVQGSFRRATGMPKLPTEDMYNEYRVHREQKMLSDSYRQKNVSIDIEPDRKFYEIRSSRRSTMKQQEFIDVHEDPRRSSRWSRRSMLTESDMEFMQKLKKSKEQDDVIDERNSKDLSREFDRQRSYSIVNSADCEGNSKSWMLERDTIGGIGGSNGSLLIEPRNVPRVHTSPKSSKAQLEEKNDARSTRIVVLRPNPGDMQSEGMSGSSPYDSHGYVPNYRKMKEYSSIGDAERISRRRKEASCNVGFSRPVSEEAKKIARKITRRMRGGCNEAVDAWFRRYAGEKDSYGDIGNDSENESEVFGLSSRNSFSNDKKWGISPSSGPVEPSVKRDAKKRLSERWKLTQRYQELEIVGKGSTLGEMLGIPDGETSLKSYGKTIKSGNGVNDKIHRTSRSRSLPPSVGRKTHSRGAYDNMLSEEQHLMHNDPLSCGRNKVGKGKLSHKEYFSSHDLKCRNKKSLPRQHLYMNEIGSSSEANFEIQMEPNVKDLSETTIQMDGKDDKRRTPVIIYERKSTTFSSKSSVLQPKQSSIIDDTYKAAGHDQKDFCLQELHKGPPKEGSPSLAYSEISKEANHASPVSVLQSPSIGNTSSSKGFEEVSAALNDLRTQLQLLKTESDSYDETSLVPIEEDIVQLSSMLPKSWKLSYGLDVLIHSGLQEFGFDMSMMMWHSPDSPLDPRLFDKLEKKYGDCETNELRVERKLLFDRINSAVLEIFQQQLDFCPWVKPKLAELPSMSPKERAVAALEKLINQEPPIEQAPGKILVDKEMLFRDSKGEINLLGNDIVKLLIDEMIIEFFV